jgi:3-hydroxyacyl-CoA dehydrogenase / enoyl-CoA hydratase / 3-hydroxybutyryl-CoA epimerase
MDGEGGGVARLWFDAPGTPVNLVTHAALDALDRALAEVELRAAAGELRALVLLSGKRAFSGGADMDQVKAFTSAEAAAAQARRGQEVLRRLERLEVPTVAAVSGACLGAGAELTLACAYRVAAEGPGTRIGFPEVEYGLLPALGGTVRLPRLVGLRTALDLILTARNVDADEALRTGLVDALLPARGFADAAVAFARARGERGRLRTGARRGLARRLVEETAPGRRAIFMGARRAAVREERLTSPAALALEAIADVLALPLDAAFAREAEAFGVLAAAPEGRAMLHAGAVMRAHRRRLRGVEREGTRLEQVALVGGGAMAGGLAYRLARAKVVVRIREPRRPLAEAALSTARACAAWDRSHAGLDAAGAARALERISAGRGYGGFGAVQLVLSLPGTDREDALAEAMQHVAEGCAAAWTGATAAPEPAIHRLPGIRFFPAPAEPRLAEIVAGEEDDARAVGLLAHLARRVGALPLPVHAGAGTVAGRLLLAYAGEALRVAAEGVDRREVEAALDGFGMLAGPLAVAEAADYERLAAMALALPGDAAAALEADTLVPLLRQRADAAAHERRRPRRLRRHTRGAATAAEAIRERVLLALLAEAARLVDAGTPPATVELAARFGLGFPPARGGVLFEADRRGAGAMVDSLEALAERHGPRYVPASVLRTLAEAGRGFHGG